MAETIGTIGTIDFFYYLLPGSMITVGLVLLYDMFSPGFEALQFLSLELTEASFWIYLVLFGFISYLLGHIVIWPISREIKSRKGKTSRKVLKGRPYLIDPICSYWNIDKKTLLSEKRWLRRQRIYGWTYRLVMQIGSEATIERLRRNIWVRRFHRNMVVATVFLGVSLCLWGLTSDNILWILGAPLIFPGCTFLFGYRQKNSDEARKRIVLDHFFVLWATKLLPETQNKEEIKKLLKLRARKMSVRADMNL